MFIKCSSFEQQCIHSDFVYKLFNSSNLRYKKIYFEDFYVRWSTVQKYIIEVCVKLLSIYIYSMRKTYCQDDQISLLPPSCVTDRQFEVLEVCFNIFCLSFFLTPSVLFLSSQWCLYFIQLKTTNLQAFSLCFCAYTKCVSTLEELVYQLPNEK